MRRRIRSQNVQFQEKNEKKKIEQIVLTIETMKTNSVREVFNENEANN